MAPALMLAGSLLVLVCRLRRGVAGPLQLVALGAAVGALAWVAPAAAVGFLPLCGSVFARWLPTLSEASLRIVGGAVVAVTVAGGVVVWRELAPWIGWLGPLGVLSWLAAAWMLAAGRLNSPREAALALWGLWTGASVVAAVALEPLMTRSDLWFDRGLVVDAWIAVVPAMALWNGYLFVRLQAKLGRSMVAVLVSLFALSVGPEVEREWRWKWWAGREFEIERRAGSELRTYALRLSADDSERLFLVGPDSEELERLMFWTQLPVQLRDDLEGVSVQGEAPLRVALPHWYDPGDFDAKPSAGLPHLDQTEELTYWWIFE